jgi:AraC-like DNA-binding protein
LDIEGQALVTKALGILQGKFGRVALLDMDTSLVPHAHPHCHIVLKVSGPDQVFTIKNENFDVREDTAVLVNTWEQHHYVHRNYDVRTVFLALYIEPSWLKGADRSFVSCEKPTFFPCSGVAITDEIRKMRSKLVQCIECDGYDDCKDVEKMIFRLTAEVAHQFADWRGTRQPEPVVISDYRIRRAIRHMREHFRESVDFNELARASGLSRPHFNYLFRQCTGVSPSLYRNAIRIEGSVRALSEQNTRLMNLFEGLGFSAQGNFTRFFRQHTGVNPHQFRRVLAELD